MGEFCPKASAGRLQRYALKREVATERSVFPWSMSDFKPGEQRKLQVDLRNTPYCAFRV